MKTLIVVLSALALVLSSAGSVRAEEKTADADAAFLGLLDIDQHFLLHARPFAGNGAVRAGCWSSGVV